MKTLQFLTTAHAKCILAGEHAVLNGCPALVIPLLNRWIKLSYQPSNGPLNLITDDDIIHTTFSKTLLEGLTLISKGKEEVQGEFTLENTIPIGAGLGFSAALCVAIARWFIWKEWIKSEDLFSFSLQLENLHHGESSGLDIAGVLADQITHYESAPNKIFYPIEVKWVPKFYLSFTGTSKATELMVNKVKLLRKTDRHQAEKLDRQMKEGVMKIEQSLLGNEKTDLLNLAAAITTVSECFREWGLITSTLQNHLNRLHQLGALAAKPTGAGGGGYVISLWETKPPELADIEWISA